VISWFRRRGTAQDSKSSNRCVCGDGNFDYEIVGEASYQDRLRQISAGRRERGERHVNFPCYLRFEINSHTHAPAVLVDASGGRTVGYFPAEQAKVYAPILREIELSGREAECVGVLVGGYRRSGCGSTSSLTDSDKRVGRPLKQGRCSLQQLDWAIYQAP
jgi:hypothetical protein